MESFMTSFYIYTVLYYLALWFTTADSYIKILLMSSFIISCSTQRLNKGELQVNECQTPTSCIFKTLREKSFYERRKMFTRQLTARHLYHDFAHNVMMIGMRLNFLSTCLQSKRGLPKHIQNFYNGTSFRIERGNIYPSD